MNPIVATGQPIHTDPKRIQKPKESQRSDGSVNPGPRRSRPPQEEAAAEELRLVEEAEAEELFMAEGAVQAEDRYEPAPPSDFLPQVKVVFSEGRINVSSPERGWASWFLVWFPALSGLDRRHALQILPPV